jgi:hypothetical protein
MLALDADYRRRFGGSRLLSITIRNAVPGVLAVVVLVLAVILLVVTFH